MCESHRRVAPTVGTSLPSVEAQPTIISPAGETGKSVGRFREAVGGLIVNAGLKIKGK